MLDQIVPETLNFLLYLKGQNIGTCWREIANLIPTIVLLYLTMYVHIRDANRSFDFTIDLASCRMLNSFHLFGSMIEISNLSISSEFKIDEFRWNPIIKQPFGS
jgi:hypothetical protein